MAGPLAAAGIMFGAGLLGELLSGGGDIPDELRDLAGTQADAGKNAQSIIFDLLNEARGSRDARVNFMQEFADRGGFTRAGLPGLSDEEREFLLQSGFGGPGSGAALPQAGVGALAGGRQMIGDLQAIAQLFTALSGGGGAAANLGGLTSGLGQQQRQGFGQGLEGLLFSILLESARPSFEQTINAPPARNLADELDLDSIGVFG